MENAKFYVRFSLGLSFCICFCIGQQSPMGQSNIDENNAANANVTNNTEIINFLALLQEGEEKVYLSDKYKNITLVLGNTGTGKSSFMQWFAGDNDKLKSVEIKNGEDDDDENIEDDDKDDAQYLIEDGNRIGSSLKSKTIFPEFVVDSETDSAYYDCPGFSDTRSRSNDLATTYFIKKLTDHAENVKLIFVANFPSVTKGVDRLTFPRLVEHATELVQNTEKFNDSIALVVTMVNKPKTRSEKIVKNIANFLQEYKREMEDDLVNFNVSEIRKKYYHNAINLMNILTIKNNGSFARIGLFRSPNEKGILSNIGLLQEGKKDMKKLLYGNIKFSLKENDDFGYTISDKSKNFIGKLMEKTKTSVRTSVESIVHQLKTHIKKLSEDICVQISKNNDNFSENNTLNIAENFNTSLFTVMKLVKTIEQSNEIEEIVLNIRSATFELDITFCDRDLTNISRQWNFLKFLRAVSNENITMQNFHDLFKQLDDVLLVSMMNLKKDITNTATKVNAEMRHEIENIEEKIKEKYYAQLDNSLNENLLDELNNEYFLIKNLELEISNSSDHEEKTSIFARYISKQNFPKYRIYGTDEILMKISKYEKNLRVLEILSFDEVLIESPNWAELSSKILKLINESNELIKFLIKLEVGFSDYNIQNKILKNNLVIVEYLGNLDKISKKEVFEHNFHEFLRYLNEYGIDSDSIKEIELNVVFLKKLNKVLKSTLHSTIVPQCSKQGELTLKGDFIKFSDFSDINGPIRGLCDNGIINSMNIFALHTVFIDRDFKATGEKLQLSIVAPRWTIIGCRKINLKGSTGIDHEPLKAFSLGCPGCNGIDGKPGLPGGAAGNFLGIGQKFSNMRDLVISVDGGDGGKGQNGQDGFEGYKGVQGDEKSVCIEKRTIVVVVANHVTYECEGYRGGKGGNGGNGGAGGFAGPNGEVKLHPLSKEFDFPTITYSSISGKDGKGGDGGLGGRTGDTYSYLRRHDIYTLFIPFKLFKNYTLSDKRVEQGYVGVDGQNILGIQKSEEKLALQNSTYILNIFKRFLLENMKIDFKEHSLIEFKRLIENKFN